MPRIKGILGFYLEIYQVSKENQKNFEFYNEKEKLANWKVTFKLLSPENLVMYNVLESIESKNKCLLTMCNCQLYIIKFINRKVFINCLSCTVAT